jgi:23S rRNA pseudouridine2457 synthase
MKNQQKISGRTLTFSRPSLPQHSEFVTLALNKPYGVLSCFTDSEGRPTLAGFISVPDVYPAGRLDYDSEGLLLLTSDGALAHQITDPRHKLPKLYWVQVDREPDATALASLREGVVVGGRRTQPADVELLSDPPSVPERAVPIRYRKAVPTAWLRITLAEGLNRQIRRMTAAVGHPTLRLIRVAIGPITLDDLQPGQWRELSHAEVEKLRKAKGDARPITHSHGSTKI